MKLPLPCIICDKDLQSVIPTVDKTAPTKDVLEYQTNQPYAATTFETYGHYGSTVFDPMNSDCYLEINICDECLKKKKDKVLFNRKTTNVHITTKRLWDPEND